MSNFLITNKIKLGSWGQSLMPIIITWEAEIGWRIKVRSQPGQDSLRDPPPNLQKNQSETNWRRGLRVERLLCKCKALSSNSGPTKKRKRERGKEKKGRKSGA
jgi:hypothetical protein